MKYTLHSIRQFDEIAAEIESRSDENDRIARFCEYVLAPEAVPEVLLTKDPFSKEYHDASKDFLQILTGRHDYKPEAHERSEFLDQFESGIYVPSIYRHADSKSLGDAFSAAGAILTALDVGPGDTILEYGAGDGQLALALARMGCEVCVIDIDERYLKIIELQAKALGVSIKVVHGAFGDPVPGIQFDRILFYEAFHHDIDHAQTLLKMRSVLKPSGRLILAGEPIIPRDSYWRGIVPFPWGPRLDGLSLRAMRTHGWCELGFRREYLVERLMRSGWLAQFQNCTVTDRGNVCIAESAGDKLDLGKPYEIETTIPDDGWSGGEGEFRWTNGNASIALDQTRCATRIEVELHNSIPVTTSVELVANDVRRRVTLMRGEVRKITLPLSARYDVLRIFCKPVAIRSVVPGSVDDRSVGIAVSTIQYFS